MASSSDTSQKEKPVPLGGKVWAFSGNGGRRQFVGVLAGLGKWRPTLKKYALRKSGFRSMPSRHNDPCGASAGALLHDTTQLARLLVRRLPSLSQKILLAPWGAHD